MQFLFCQIDVRARLEVCLVGALLIGLFRPDAVLGAGAHDLQRQIAERESAGDLSGARSLLQKQALDSGDANAQFELALFLDRHDEAGRRDAFLKYASVETDPQRRRLALRQALLIDFMENQSGNLQADLSQYQGAGGKDLALPHPDKTTVYSTIQIPGPLSSFARMAALTPDVDPEGLIPALARNVVTSGYQASGNEFLQQTEYLKLIVRYLAQARELQALANQAHQIVIPTCDSEQTGNLLKVLGYRMRGSCGADIALETVNPSRAFLTIDSGFPLATLERDLRANHRFELPYPPSSIPVLYSAEYWLNAAGKASNSPAEMIDVLIGDPGLCRLYLGLSKLDRPTADLLKKQLPAEKLRVYAAVLDFYGEMFQVKNGAAVVPGSTRAWAGLVGVQPGNPAAFFDKLLIADDGWMAGYFDALMRLDDGPTRTYLTEGDHLRRFYDALRGKITSPGPARPVFRSTSDLLLLTTSLRLDADGTPHVPGGLDVWKMLFAKHPRGRYDSKLVRAAGSWRSKDDFIEALFALSRKTAENEPLDIFLALNDIDRGRSRPISSELAARLVSDYHNYGAQYRLFSETPTLSEASMVSYLNVCQGSSKWRDAVLKADAVGSTEAAVEIWSILARQNLIPQSAQDSTFSAVVGAFARVSDEDDLFGATRTSLDAMLSAAGATGSGSRQERLLELMVGPMRAGSEALPSPPERFGRLFDAQDLIPIDALLAAQAHFAAQHNVTDRGARKPLDPKVAKVIDEQLDRLRETQALHESVSSDEKTSGLGQSWMGRHVVLERKLDLDTLAKNPDQHDARAALAGLLRDSLVGIVYCYYAPPEAQILLTNSSFVRNHDFAGNEGSPAFWQITQVSGPGWPSSAGGRLSGSLISLPYALAEAEQNFMSPRRRQALIWTDLVPQMVIDVTIPHWKNVTPMQLRWISLHLERGRTLMAAAGLDANVRTAVLASLTRYLTPGEVDRIGRRLQNGSYVEATEQIPPATLYAISQDATLKGVSPDVASEEIGTMAAGNRPELTEAAIARAFGTPKPTLMHSYTPALTYLRTFPALMGFSSRILAETWESNNLYYAALADQAGVSAAELDVYIPEWNRTAIENIFAANLEDWPALIRSLQMTRDSVLHRTAGTQESAAIASSNN